MNWSYVDFSPYEVTNTRTEGLSLLNQRGLNWVRELTSASFHPSF